MATCIHLSTLPCKPRNLSLSNLLLPSSPPLKLVTFMSVGLFQDHFSKGILSMNSFKRPVRQSVVCMARRYGSGTKKREMKSRRRGGDPEKKKKRKRKGGRKKKDTFKIVRLVSEAGSGYVYTKRKSKGKIGEKLEMKKYDPNVKHHVLFKESK